MSCLRALSPSQLPEHAVGGSSLTLVWSWGTPCSLMVLCSIKLCSIYLVGSFCLKKCPIRYLSDTGILFQKTCYMKCTAHMEDGVLDAQQLEPF
jgi:hypothetical protein